MPRSWVKFDVVKEQRWDCQQEHDGSYQIPRGSAADLDRKAPSPNCEIRPSVARFRLSDLSHRGRFSSLDSGLCRFTSTTTDGTVRSGAEAPIPKIVDPASELPSTFGPLERLRSKYLRSANSIWLGESGKYFARSRVTDLAGARAHLQGSAQPARSTQVNPLSANFAIKSDNNRVLSAENTLDGNCQKLNNHPTPAKSTQFTLTTTCRRASDDIVVQPWAVTSNGRQYATTPSDNSRSRARFLRFADCLQCMKTLLRSSSKVGPSLSSPPPTVYSQLRYGSWNSR